MSCCSVCGSGRELEKEHKQLTTRTCNDVWIMSCKIPVYWITTTKCTHRSGNHFVVHTLERRTGSKRLILFFAVQLDFVSSENAIGVGRVYKFFFWLPAEQVHQLDDTTSPGWTNWIDSRLFVDKKTLPWPKRDTSSLIKISKQWAPFWVVWKTGSSLILQFFFKSVTGSIIITF